MLCSSCRSAPIRRNTIARNRNRPRHGCGEIRPWRPGRWGLRRRHRNCTGRCARWFGRPQRGKKIHAHFLKRVLLGVQGETGSMACRCKPDPLVILTERRQHQVGRPDASHVAAQLQRCRRPPCCGSAIRNEPVEVGAGEALRRISGSFRWNDIIRPQLQHRRRDAVDELSGFMSVADGFSSGTGRRC